MSRPSLDSAHVCLRGLGAADVGTRGPGLRQASPAACVLRVGLGAGGRGRLSLRAGAAPRKSRGAEDRDSGHAAFCVITHRVGLRSDRGRSWTAPHCLWVSAALSENPAGPRQPNRPRNLRPGHRPPRGEPLPRARREWMLLSTQRKGLRVRRLS